jgi:hypothetical protein
MADAAGTSMAGDDGEEARRFTRARRGCGGMKTDPGAATGGCQIYQQSGPRAHWAQGMNTLPVRTLPGSSGGDGAA